MAGVDVALYPYIALARLREYGNRSLIGALTQESERIRQIAF
jgi:hypothetical protein